MYAHKEQQFTYSFGLGMAGDDAGLDLCSFKVSNQRGVA